MPRPVLLAVDDAPDLLAEVGREMEDRYGRQYEVVCLRSPGDARDRLAEYATSGVEVALVLAGPWLDGATGGELLREVRHLHPHAMRSLLIAWGDWGQKATGQAIFDGIAQGHFDSYVLRPAGSPDELFHQAISGLLLDWSESQRAAPFTVHIVAESWSGRAHELRDALRQCAISHNFCLADSARGRELVAAAGAGVALPIIVFPDGTVLENPSNTEIAVAAGSPVNPKTMDFDVVIVGAGPAGLSAAVYGASEGFATLVVDRGGIGGQATSSALIRNYLGFPRGLSGRQLAQRAYNQAWVFGANFAFMQTATGLAREGDHLLVELSDGGPVRTRAVLLAMGASYRRLGVPSLEALRRCRRLLRRHDLGGSWTGRPRGLHRRRRKLGGSGRPPSRPLHEARHAWSSGRRPSAPACRSTWCARSRRRAPSTSESGPRWSVAAATTGSSTSSSAT